MSEGYDGLPAYYSQSSDPLTPNLGLSLKGMDPIVAENFVLVDVAVGSGSSSVFVNGVAVSNPNFNNTTPAAIAGVNVLWQKDVAGHVSAYVDTSTFGTVSSVAMTGDGVIFNSTVGGSPITSSGTLVPALLTQTANKFLAGPTSGGAATPTFRALVTADLPAGVGTVTSVAMTGDNVIYSSTVGGSPVTTSGTLIPALKTQTANLALMGPTSGGAATPTFRALVTADLPAGTGTVTSVAMTGDGVIFNSTVGGSPIATSGTLIPALLTQTANFVLAGPTSGSAATPTFRALVSADIPSGTVLWNQIGAAAGALTLANAGNATTFQQTSAVAWLWDNTTVATSGTTNASPTHQLAARYWTGAASATDTWTLQSSLLAGTNGASTLTIAHSGSTGATNIQLPNSIKFVCSGQELDLGPNFIFTGTSGVGTQVLRAFNAGCNIAYRGNMQSTAGFEHLVQNAGVDCTATSGTSGLLSVGPFSTAKWAPTSGSGTYNGLSLFFTANQTGSASGSYTALKVNVTETALLGTANLLLDLQAGASGGTSMLSVTNAGVLKCAAVNAPVTVNVQTGTTYTAVLADANQLATLNNASAIAWTIPTNASVAFPVGTTLTVTQLGAGQVTITAAGGVTINTPSSLTTRAQYSTVAVVQVAANTWVAGGDLT